MYGEFNQNARIIYCSKMRQLYCKCIVVVEKIDIIKTFYDRML